MAYGGGTFTTQNKTLPGAYINFVSVTSASATLSDRGVAAAPFTLSWGPEERVFEVTAAEFIKNSKKIFGYGYDAPGLLGLREIFRHAVKVYCYRLGTSTKAENDYATARYGGVRGNDLTLKITKDVDNTELFVVATLLDGAIVDEQKVKVVGDLADNDFVCFKNKALTASSAGIPLTGGADCDTITGEHYQTFLDKLESYSFNTLCCPVANGDQIVGTVQALFVNYTKRMREEVGAKFQTVVQAASDVDYEGVISVANYGFPQGHTFEVETPPYAEETAALLYWVTGAQAATAVNKTLTNTAYDGEILIRVDHTQAELETLLKAGQFVFHNANGKVRVLEDVNTLVTFTAEKGEIFQSNQTVRVCDQIANDVAVLFNTKYLGIVPNDASGRATLWNDIVKLIRELETIRAVEDFDTDTVSVDIGDRKGSVLLTIDGLNIVNAMSQLYMSVIIQ